MYTMELKWSPYHAVPLALPSSLLEQKQTKRNDYNAVAIKNMFFVFTEENFWKANASSAKGKTAQVHTHTNDMTPKLLQNIK